MSPGIIEEVDFFLNSFLMGILITFVYDLLIIFRKVIRHNHFCISLEDLLFWIGCAVGIFAMLYKENNGAPRWFAIAGAAAGMTLYKLTVSRLFIKATTAVLTAILHVCGKIAGVLAKPVVFAGRRTGKFAGKIRRFISKTGRLCKKKLTSYGKVIKIILCKQ